MNQRLAYKLHNRLKGFTLIELMIVVAVVAILAAIAYPSFQDQIRKSRRAQAKADLVEYAALAERFHTTNNTYAGFALPSNRSPREAGGVAHYTLALNPAATQSAFTITATAATASQQADRCGNLSLNQAGVKGRSTAVPLSECW